VSNNFLSPLPNSVDHTGCSLAAKLAAPTAPKYKDQLALNHKVLCSTGDKIETRGGETV